MSTAAAREKGYSVVSANRWGGVDLAGVEVRPDGRLELLRVPALAEPIALPPAPTDPSGLALDDACGLYVSDAERGRIVRVALDCPGRLVVEVDGAPAGLALGPFGWLFAADPEGGRVLVYRAGELTLRSVWTAELSHPVATAYGGGRSYVLDAGPPAQVGAFDAEGRTGPPLAAKAPRAIAAASDGTLYVADADAPAILRFDRAGNPVGDPLADGTAVQALAVAGDLLYVADETSGTVLVLDRRDGRSLGALAGFRGPVSALAAAADGTAYVKTGGGEAYAVAEARAARVTSGTVTTQMLDAGEEGAWFRAVADADVPPGTALRLATAEDGGAWVDAAGPDTLLAGSRRLRLRLTLERDELGAAATATPIVAQLQAETEGDPYLDYLPSVYARSAEAGGFLRRLLALLQGVFGDREAAADAVARLVDPATAPAERLPRLAGWQGLEVPKRLLAVEEADQLRDLLAELPQLYERRGTPLGIVRAAELHAGVRPALFEHFRSRRIWALDAPAALGIDTMLVATTPGGIGVGADVVGASGPEEGDAWGAALFDETAHRFTAVVPAAMLDGERRAQLERILDAEKPAQTAYHVCAAPPKLRVGVQAAVGLDSIVAGPGDALALDQRGRLGLDARTASHPDDEPGAVGRRGRLGVETLLG